MRRGFVETRVDFDAGRVLVSIDAKESDFGWDEVSRGTPLARDIAIIKEAVASGRINQKRAYDEKAQKCVVIPDGPPIP